MNMEIKIQLNDFDHIVVDDIYNGGIRFRMYSKSQMGQKRVFNDGTTQFMSISEHRIESVIKALQDMKKMIGKGEK